VSSTEPHDRAAPPARWRWALAGIVVVLATAVGAALASAAFGGSGARPAGSEFQTGTATVTRQSLTSQTQVNATLGDAGSWTLAIPSPSSSSSSTSAAGSSGSGTFTWLPQPGHVIHQGHRIYSVSGSPVALLYGRVPAYRDLYEGLTGADVKELNTDLVELGYATSSALGPRSGWDYFGGETAYAVEQLQTKLGLTVTGSLALGEAAFLPGAALITAWGPAATLGGAAAPGAAVLTASSTTPVVTIDLDPGQQSQVKAGDPVSITLPNGSTTPGMISEVSRVATSPSSSSGSDSGSQGSSGSAQGSSDATINVLVSLTNPEAAGKLNQAPVTVTITTGHVADALTVPVDALLAQSGGGYAVEVTGPGPHHLVKVTPGLFDDAAGRVQITGALTPGQHVVVPGI
jgi:Putative peptidoglycan binding domain